MRGGLQPDLLSNAGWWQTRLWQFAVFAVVLFGWVAAERPEFQSGRLLGGSPPGAASSESRDRLW